MSALAQILNPLLGAEETANDSGAESCAGGSD